VGCNGIRGQSNETQRKHIVASRGEEPYGVFPEEWPSSRGAFQAPCSTVKGAGQLDVWATMDPTSIVARLTLSVSGLIRGQTDGAER
jgi:hypothetical protein